MNSANLLSSFGAENEKYTLLIPDNSAFEADGIFLNYYAEGGKLEQKPEGEWEAVSSDELQRIIRAHTVMSEEVELKKQGTQIIPIQSAFCYWFVKDGKITCSNHFNGVLEPGSTIDPLSNLKKSPIAVNHGQMERLTRIKQTLYPDCLKLKLRTVREAVCKKH